MELTYYHNPKCSKSRSGLEMLENRNIHFTIKEYLKEPLSIEEVLSLFAKLGLPILDALRKKEPLFIDHHLEEMNWSHERWAKFIVENPIVLERPILVNQTHAVIGRPTQNLESLL